MDANRIVQEFQSMIYADKIILGYPKLKCIDGVVNLHYYNVTQIMGAGNNLGDYLSRIVVEWMLKKKGLSLETSVCVKKHLYAIGSILLMGYQNSTVWGTGFPFFPTFFRSFPHRYPFRKLDVRCVRGPLTREVMKNIGQKCPEVYGDPAVLMPLIYQPLSRDKLLEYIVIPHYSTESLLESVPETNIVSMNTTDYKMVIDKICSARKVVSSSLHGIILAEAYGVPAVFYQDRPQKYDFKYADYYLSTGRNMKKLYNLEEAIQDDGMILPDLEAMRMALVESFPYDMWQ